MADTQVFDAAWHLDHSRPEALLCYLDPTRSFMGQINRLTERFRRVQTLCAGGDDTTALLKLRNALAFHLVKMSRWWHVDFCPRGTTGVRNPLFLTYVHAHLQHSLKDEMLYDVLTMQLYMHANEGGHILILHQEIDERLGVQTLYGIDGHRNFRFSNGSPGDRPVWNDRGHPDFAGAWLAAGTVRALIAGNGDSMTVFRNARGEHELARVWHHRHFHVRCERRAVAAYDQSIEQLSACRTPFGRASFEAIANDCAFRVARMAASRSMTLADFAEAGGMADANPRVAIALKRRARAHVASVIDETRRDESDACLDRLIAYLPRRCG